MSRSFGFLPLLVVVCGTCFAAQLKQVAVVDLPGAPGFDGLAFVGQYLAITHPGAATVDIFDPGRRRTVAQVKDVENPQGIAVDNRAGRLYVASAGSNAIVIVSTTDWRVVETIRTNTAPYALALSADGGTLYVANWRGQSVTKVELQHGNHISEAQLGGTPSGMVFSPERQLLYVSVQDRREVLALDTNLRIVSHFSMVASQPTGLALGSANGRLYVAVRNAVVALKLDTGAETGRVAAPPGANALWFDPAEQTLYVASGGGYVSMIRADPAGFVPLDEIRTDVRGSTLAYDAQRRLAFMPGGREGKSKLLILRRVEDTPSSQSSHPRTTP